MKISAKFLENDIELSNSYIRCLEIENKKYFYRFVNCLNKSANDGIVDEILIDENIKFDSFFILFDYFNLLSNSRKLVQSINKEIKERITEETYNELLKRYKKLLVILKKVIGQIDIPTTITEEINVEGLIKLLNVSINFSNDLLTNLLLLIDINRELGNQKELVFINLKQYLTTNELEELYKYAIYNNQIIMLIDSQSYGVSKKYEKKILIDVDLEEYML